MIGQMNNETVKRYSLAEIALLAIFVLGLAIAYMIVEIRHRVILSEPIGLVGSGLSVSMPTNPGWEYETTWRYESDNNMALIAQLQVGRTRKASILWRYAICSPSESAQDILQQRVQQSDSKIDDIKTLSSPLPMHYTIVYPSGSSDNAFYLGVIPLDFGRHLELQVFIHQQLDFSYAETLFRALAGGIHYQPPQQLQAGKDQLDVFWNMMQSNSFSFGKKSDEAFLIKNTENQPVGYAYHRYSTLGANSETRLQLLSRQYEHKSSLVESTFWFDSDQKRFTWKTTINQTGMGRARDFTLIQESNGTVNINTNFEKDKQFASDSLLLPEVLLPECAALFLERQQNSLIVDVLAPMGFVVPTVMEKIDIQSALARSEQIAFVVKIEFLNNPNSFEELYFDKDRRLIGRFERQPLRKRLWELTTPDNLEQIFQDNFQPVNNEVAFVK